MKNLITLSMIFSAAVLLGGFVVANVVQPVSAATLSTSATTSTSMSTTSSLSSTSKTLSTVAPAGCYRITGCGTPGDGNLNCIVCPA